MNLDDFVFMITGQIFLEIAVRISGTNPLNYEI